MCYTKGNILSEKIAYEKNKGRNRQMEDADASQKVLKQISK
jgi:hypothetical protein